MYNIHKSYFKFIRLISVLFFIAHIAYAQASINHKNGVIICIIPETGKFTTLGNKVKQAINIYLNEVQQNKKEIIFVDENQDFIPLLRSTILYYGHIDLIIGPVFNQDTEKLADFLNEINAEIPIYSLSNDTNLLKKKNVQIFGFNIMDKISMLFSEEFFQEKNFEEIILIYNKKKFHKSFQKDFVEIAYQKVNMKPVTYPFDDVRSFSRVLKLIQSKRDPDVNSGRKTALIFLGVNKQISRYLNDFLIKYNFDPEYYEFFFFSDIAKYTKFAEKLIPVINVVEYNLSDYKEFTSYYENAYGYFPSKLALSTYDALESANIK